jgi:hypothetical protein
MKNYLYYRLIFPFLVHFLWQHALFYYYYFFNFKISLKGIDLIVYKMKNM